jgi:stage V sporulation protein B
MNSSSSSSSTSGYKTFTRGALISFAGVLLAGIISYLIRRVLVLNLSSVEYGFFYSAFSFVSLGLAVVDLGLGKSGTVLMAKYTAQKKKGRVNLFFSIILQLKLLTGILLGLLIWFWAPYLLNDYFSFPDGLTTLLCLALFVPLQAVGGFVSSSLEAMQDFKARTAVQIIYYSSILGLILLFTSFLKTLAPALAYCGAATLVLVGGLFYLRARHDLHFDWNYKRWFKVWPETWIYARWLTLSVIALATMNYIDTLMLTWLSDLNSVAGYQVALPIAQIARSLVFLPIIFMPIAADLWQRHQLLQIKNICNFVTLLMVFFAGAGFLLLLPFAEELISILFDRRYRWAYSTLIVLGSGMPILVVAQFYLNTLGGMESPGIAAFASLSGLVSNILFNFFLIPVYGALGAAIATILSFFVITLVAYFYLYQKLNFCLSWGSLFFLLVIILGAGLCYRFCGSAWVWFSVAGSIYCGTGFFILHSHFILLKRG